jgi:hypothetical protein
MRFPRVRFTLRRMLVVVAVLALVMAVVAHYERRRRAATAQAELARQEAATMMAEVHAQMASFESKTAEDDLAAYHQMFPIAAYRDRLRELQEMAELDRRVKERGQLLYIPSNVSVEAQALRSKLEFARIRFGEVGKLSWDEAVATLQARLQGAQAKEAAARATFVRERAALVRLRREVGPP